ncbi:hypothetical protein CLV96_4012 [Leptospira meyeri]|uniref:Uncharacterized protein n=1 Tax=Leptospira meyeri TaxID=29508 RepID=A0A4R8ML67_LEPME|nr:hypothetical protein [Leptospira meyeri]EKJ86142.1 hypothetical protein LEP1GSC017_0428 [Leptospira meyeri serovar Hardjo str. Went 5]TDY65975.1 hypothetical protein CLV96_4012 [Leptospira meyeri]
MKKITYNLYLTFKENIATELEINFIKENNDYFANFEVNQLKSILYPYKPKLLVNRFEENLCVELIKINSNLNLSIDDRSPTILENPIIKDDSDAQLAFKIYLAEISMHLEDDQYLIVSITNIKHFYICNYSNEKFLKSEKLDDLLFGGGPLILNKFTGKIYETSSAQPEEDIEEFRILYFPNN